MRETVRSLFLKANTELGDDVLNVLRESIDHEESDLGRFTLRKIEENARIACETGVPICQDTGLALLFIELGQDVHIVDGDFNNAIQEGVKAAYGDGYFRKSVCDPLSRKNTGDNTPAILHTEIVAGDRVRVVVMPKGGGSENMSSCTMLIPTAGIEGIKKLVIEKVVEAGPNPCPPIIVGIGIGGSIEKSIILAKKALLRPVGECNQADNRLARLEEEILHDINMLGIGPQGYGGRVTSLAVHMEMMPCHIASLPVAVNIQCHAARHREATI